MRNSNLCILACCVGVCWATFVTAQSAASGSDDQDKALQALRQAEAGSTADQVLAERAAQKEAAKQKKLRIKQEKEAKKAASAQKKKAAEEATPAVEQPAPAAPVAAASADEQSKALEALRHAEAGPVVPDQMAPAASAPAVAPAPVVATTPAVASAPVVASAPAAPAAAASADEQSKALRPCATLRRDQSSWIK